MIRTQVARMLLTVLATVGLAVGSLAATAPTAQAATQLGGLDLVKVCRVQNGNDSWWVPELVAPRTAYNWRCYNDKVRQARGIDMNSGCRIMYGGSAYARVLDTRNPYSWRCYR